MKEIIIALGIEKSDVAVVTNILNLLMNNAVLVLLAVFAVGMIVLMSSYFKIKYIGTNESSYASNKCKDYCKAYEYLYG